MSDVKLVEAPPGIEGSGFFATSMEKVVGLARSHSLWPLPFATSCCGIEFMATMGSHYDFARFGSERPSFSPRQADLLMVMGTIAKKMGPVLRQVYIQMAEPRWVIAVGACATSGGIFDTYSVLQGIDEIIPVDVYVPGCPPRPEAIIDGFNKIQELVKDESLRRERVPGIQRSFIKIRDIVMGRLTRQAVLQKITARFSENISVPTEPYGLLTFETSKENISEILRFLKEDKELQFNYLTDITGIHYPEQELSIGVIYHLHSLTNNVRVRIKVFLNGVNPVIPTATNLWEGANWMERETYDFFGIKFEGHPNLVRILNVDEMTVFPMRREYPLEDPNRVDKKDYFFGR